MTAATHYHANHKLGIADPDCEMVATGAWNPDGSPVMKRAGKTILAGTIFPVTLLQGGDAEVQYLLELGAIRPLDATETALLERDQKGA